MAQQTDIAEVIKNIQTDMTTIVRGEIALATEELKGEAAKAGVIAGLFSGAGYVGLSAAAVLFSAFGFLWAMGFQAWFGLDIVPALFWGFFVMGLLLLAIAAVMALIATWVPRPGAPTRTIARAKDEAEFLKATLTGAPADSAEGRLAQLADSE
mgnify:FL=1